MQDYGFKCIAKEADLMCELLRRGAHPVHDYLIDQSRTMRMCALSLMNCTGDNSISASAVMLVRACLQKTHLMLSSIHPFDKPMITTLWIICQTSYCQPSILEPYELHFTQFFDY